MNRWIDLTIPLANDIVVWPGDPRFRRELLADIQAGDECNVSAVNMSVHTGTHVDAPGHYLPDGAGVESLSFNALIGPARVLSCMGLPEITADFLKQVRIEPGQRLLFKTDNSADLVHGREFSNNYVSLSPDAAEYLAETGVLTVGVDYLSVGSDDERGALTHRVLLQAGICIIEFLDLSALEPGDYEMICLPLKLMGSDGAPARVIVRKL